MVGYILFYIGVLLIAFGKSIADTVSDLTHWNKSVFSKYKVDGFMGCKDNTWKRKKRKTKFWNFLFSTILVWTTDIWHFANTLKAVGIYSAIIGARLIPSIEVFDIVLHIGIFISCNITIFHMMYTYGWKKK